MIKATGSLPYIVWHSELVAKFVNHVVNITSNEVIAEILEDCQYGIHNAFVDTFGGGDFRIIASFEDTDLTEVVKYLEKIISDYELEDYL